MLNRIPNDLGMKFHKLVQSLSNQFDRAGPTCSASDNKCDSTSHLWEEEESEEAKESSRGSTLHCSFARVDSCAWTGEPLATVARPATYHSQENTNFQKKWLRSIAVAIAIRFSRSSPWPAQLLKWSMVQVAAGMVSWFLHDLDAVTQTYIFLSTSKSSLAWS